MRVTQRRVEQTFQSADNSAISITDVCVAPKLVLRVTLAHSLLSTIKQRERIVDNEKEIYNIRANPSWRRTNSSHRREREIYTFVRYYYSQKREMNTGVFSEEAKVGHLPRERTSTERFSLCGLLLLCANRPPIGYIYSETVSACLRGSRARSPFHCTLRAKPASLSYTVSSEGLAPKSQVP